MFEEHGTHPRSDALDVRVVEFCCSYQGAPEPEHILLSGCFANDGMDLKLQSLFRSEKRCYQNQALLRDLASSYQVWCDLR